LSLFSVGEAFIILVAIGTSSDNVETFVNTSAVMLLELQYTRCVHQIASVLRLLLFLFVLTRSEQYNNNTVSSLQQRKLQSRIVGGTLAKYGEFPSFVRGSGCGGTLIHPDIVLTAAHCAGAFLGETVQIGGIKRDGSDSEMIAVTTVIQHPLYGQPSRFNNDIMIVVLSASSTRPVQTLNVDSDVPANGDRLVAAGFGKRSYFSLFSYGNMRKVTVSKVSYASCNRFLGKFIKVYDDTMLCAGSWRKDTCQGDSGGPLFTADGTQVGITSFGFGCGFPGLPGAYTRISKYQVSSN
jgi:trypsin